MSGVSSLLTSPVNQDVRIVLSQQYQAASPHPNATIEKPALDDSELKKPPLQPADDPEYKLLLEIHDHMTNKKQSSVFGKRPSQYRKFKARQ